jgi:hypothetical protein
MYNAKKGQVESLIKWFFRFGLVIGVGVFLMIVLYAYLNEDFSGIHNEEVYILSRIMRSVCLSREEQGIVYASQIDPAKLTNEHLASCYKKASLGYELSLQALNGFNVASASVLSQEQKENLPLCGVRAVSLYKCTERKEYVLYKKGDEVVPGFLVMRVMNRVY